VNTFSLFSRLFLLALLPVFLTACQQVSPSEEVASARDVSAVDKVYEVRGWLVEIRQEGQSARIAHEAIPGYMAAMTMPFAVQQPSELEGLASGDAIAFRLEVAGTSSWITGVTRLSEAEAARLVVNDEPSHSKPSDASLYGLEATWTNQKGEVIHLGSLHGRPVVLSMVFTHCSYACPLIVRDMKRLGAHLSASQQDQIQYVLISLDPERDTPEVLQRFANGHALDEQQWTLLRGDAEQVRLLAALLGIRYREQADGQFAHTSLITLLNTEGEIVYQQKGLGSDNATATQTLEDMLAATQ
jgi:protein SCO1/2